MKMKIAHYSPNTFMTRFEKYLPEHTFLPNYCTEDTDIIYCGSVSQLSKALIAKEAYKKPLICWVWDIPYNWRSWCRTDEELKAHKRREAYVVSCLANLRRCEKVISASKWTQGVLKKFNIPSEQMYFYIDTEELDSVPEQENKGHVIQISRFAINKRFDLTVRAMEGIDRKLILVGRYGHGCEKPLAGLAESLGVEVEIHVNLDRTKLIKLLKQSELLVSPSVFEGWGMSPIEALHCNKAVLLSDLEVFREVYGDIAIYHKRDDLEGMNRQIRKLIYIENFCEMIAQEGKLCISAFTIPKFADRWNRVIKRFTT